MPSPVIEPDRSIDAAVLYGVVTAFAATVGAAGLTVRVTVAVVEPSELAAITLYMTGTVDSAVGVPEMVQVVASMFSPVGSAGLDRKSVVSGKSVSVSVDLGGRRNIKKKKQADATLVANR